jgi:hypothetical protein
MPPSSWKLRAYVRVTGAFNKICGGNGYDGCMSPAGSDFQGPRPITDGEVDSMDRVQAALRAQASAAATPANAVSAVSEASGPAVAGPTTGLGEGLERAELLDEGAAMRATGRAIDAQETVHDAAMHGNPIARAVELAGAAGAAGTGQAAQIHLEKAAIRDARDDERVHKVEESPQDDERRERQERDQDE